MVRFDQERSRYLSEGLFDGPLKGFFPEELFVIGSSKKTPEQKSRAISGRMDLAVASLIAWDYMQADLRGLPSLAPLSELLKEEKVELEEVHDLEMRLQVNEEERGEYAWYDQPDALSRWKVASEIVDVMVFVEAILRDGGATPEVIMGVFEGKKESAYTGLIGELKERMVAIGVDPCEGIILKSELNVQHRPPGMRPEWKGNGFMRTMRRTIGDASSQIPHLAGGPLGETVLTRLQAPIYCESQASALINLLSIVRDEQLVPVMGDESNFASLYVRVGDY